jgi:hypothetical protein
VPAPRKREATFYGASDLEKGRKQEKIKDLDERSGSTTPPIEKPMPKPALKVKTSAKGRFDSYMGRK